MKIRAVRITPTPLKAKQTQQNGLNLNKNINQNSKSASDNGYFYIEKVLNNRNDKQKSFLGKVISFFN